MKLDLDTPSTIRREYRKLADLYEKRWGKYIAKTNYKVLELLGISSGKKILDIACGTCFLEEQIFRRVQPALIVGIDLTLEMLHVAKNKFLESRPLYLLNSEAKKLPFQDESFDVVCCVSSFHFFENPEKVLNEYFRVLKPDGRLIIIDWCRDFIICKAYDLYLRIVSKSHCPPYTINGMGELLKKTSFNPITSRTFRVGFVWGMMALEYKKKS